MNDLPNACLLIDDDPDDQEIFQLCVHQLEETLPFTAMGNGEEAITWLLENPAYVPRWIFVDWNIPLKNGLDCLRELRAIDRLRETSIYMYSTITEPLIESKSRELGATGFIVKPVKPSELKAILKEIIHGSDPV